MAALPPLPGTPFANNPAIPPVVLQRSTEVTDQDNHIWEASDLFNVAMRYKVRATDTTYGVFSVVADPTDSTPVTPFSWSPGVPSDTDLQTLEQVGLPFEVWYCRRTFDASAGVWNSFEEPTRSGEVDTKGYVPPAHTNDQVLKVEGGTPTWGTIDQDNVEDLTEDLDAIKKRLDDLEEKTADPTAPTMTATNITSTSFTLSWSGGSVKTGTYNVQEFVNNAWTSTIQETDTSALTLTSLFPAARTAGTTYMFRVRRGTGPWSETLSVTTLGTAQTAPTPPTITVSNITQTTFTLSWSGGSVTTGQWELQYFTSGAWASQIKSSTVTSTNITGRTAATAYRYRVRRGSGPWATTTVTTLAAAPTPEVPTPPATAPTISVTTTRNSATVSYSGGSVTTGAWQVQYKESNVLAWTEAIGEGTTSVTISSLSAGTAYDFRVRRGSGPWRAQNNVSTQSAPTDRAPTIRVTTTHNSATVSYSGGSVSTGTWRVQFRRNGAAVWRDITGEGTASATITGLRGSTAYDFRVRRGNRDSGRPLGDSDKSCNEGPAPWHCAEPPCGHATARQDTVGLGCPTAAGRNIV